MLMSLCSPLVGWLEQQAARNREPLSASNYVYFFFLLYAILTSLSRVRFIWMIDLSPHVMLNDLSISRDTKVPFFQIL